MLYHSKRFHTTYHATNYVSVISLFVAAGEVGEGGLSGWFDTVSSSAYKDHSTDLLHEVTRPQKAPVIRVPP